MEGGGFVATEVDGSTLAMDARECFLVRPIGKRIAYVTLLILRWEVASPPTYNMPRTFIQFFSQLKFRQNPLLSVSPIG